MEYWGHENVEIRAIEKPRDRCLKSLSSLGLPSICFASPIYPSENWGEIEVQEEAGTFADKCSANVQDRGGAFRESLSERETSI
jgi:DNA repair photolyase